MSACDLAVGVPSRKHPDLLPPHSKIDEFTSLVSEEWKNSLNLVKQARREQDKRKIIRMPDVGRGANGMKITP